jgi:hypothetical protein
LSCRRSYDIELASFLANPGDPQFEAFRAHYPTCVECAAEVRIWTELDAALRGDAGSGGHPVEELLLRFEEAPQELQAAARESVRRHVEGCRSCRDELAALRRFSPAAARPSESSPARLRRLLLGLRGVLLHPAFAYGLVLLLLYPAVTSFIGDRGSRRPPETPREATADRALPPARAPAPRPAAVPRDELERALGQAPSSVGQAPSSVRPAPSSAIEEPRRSGEVPSPAREAASADATAQSSGGEPTHPLGEAPQQMAAGELRVPAPESARSTSDSELPRGAGPKEARESHGLVLTRLGEPVELDRGRAEGELTLRMLPPHFTDRGAAARLHIVGTDGSRELREEARVGGDGMVRMGIPRGWLEPGAYRVEVSVGAPGTDSESSVVYRFRVR